MRLLNLESLRHCGAYPSTGLLQNLDCTMSAMTAPVIYRRILEGRQDDLSNILDFSKVSGVSLKRICCELIRQSGHNLPAQCRLSEDHVILVTNGD